ncbi:MAG: sugar ABC transporter ATP-binding protein [Spirochaetaceae bacterium]|nr:MAG: sugar ABC transporter ATP-binding protein [Spirochaetaceae bacterium]
MSDYVLEIENVSKSFPGVRALQEVELKVRPGTVHGVMGENGAGKSTLMKIIIGLYTADKGTIRYKGNILELKDVNDALNVGISMIHQELSPLPFMTVAQNIFLGREKRNKLGFIDHQAIDQATANILKDLNIKLRPTAIMGTLSIAQMQLVEIAKAVSYDASVVIMDEPTSTLTEQEVKHLFRIIEDLKSRGVAVVYITHKMDEVFGITDEVTVYRDGEFVGTDDTRNLTRESLIQKMVGRSFEQFFHKQTAAIEEVVLEVENLCRGKVFRDVSFSVRRGEILGFAGLVGAGRSEVMETLFGIYPKTAGRVVKDGRELDIRSPKDAIGNRIAFLTEDRKGTGLYLNLSVRDNVAIANLVNYLKGGVFIDHQQVRAICDDSVAKLRIRTPSLDQLVLYLSGGNQQKVVVSRWLAMEPDILILDEPTRGIDVGAKSEIYKLMSELAFRGKAIILISSELPEILAMSDRVVVMHEGDKVGELTREELSQELILHMATGEPRSTFAGAQQT